MKCGYCSRPVVNAHRSCDGCGAPVLGSANEPTMADIEVLKYQRRSLDRIAEWAKQTALANYKPSSMSVLGSLLGSF